MRKRKRGLFITFEGIDGCGKSTQAMLTYKYLIALGKQVKLLREPGSTEVAEKIRAILLDKKHAIEDVTELLLYEAARAETTAREIAPELNAGRIVLCDRFYDSTTAYQGFGRKLNTTMVRALHRVAVGDIAPDLTLVFDVDLRTAKAFFERVRKGFLEIARKERRRVKVIDAAPAPDLVFEDVKKYLVRKLRSHESTRSV